MTMNLAEKTCTPCRGGVPPLTAQEAEELRRQAPEWALMDEAHRIERTFRFRDFREALTFVQKVGDLAESEGRHSAGATRRCPCGPRRSRDCTRTISSWQQRSTGWLSRRMIDAPEHQA